MSHPKKSFQYGDHTVTIETGELARQADGAVLVTMSDTVVLVTAVGLKKPTPGRDFFPLTVNYQEKTYAAGRIPGGFFKREGRPTEKETLTSRLIDRPIRPLFPDGFTNDVQVVASVLSVNSEVDPDIASLIGASAALAISGMPFMGPIGAARVGYKDGKYILNPTATQLDDIEARSGGCRHRRRRADGRVRSERFERGNHARCGDVRARTDADRDQGDQRACGRGRQAEMDLDHALGDRRSEAGGRLFRREGSGCGICDHREAAASQPGSVKSRTRCSSALAGGESPKFTKEEVGTEFFNLEYRLVRERILAGHPRIDGRDTKTVRPINIRTGVLARTHGSALFTRGETQALVVTTLGTGRDAQIIDGLTGERKEPFMLHYNFPPFSVGETGMMGSPKRREIGHGNLAKRGVKAVMPDLEKFPYVIRVVSEILESNGSSSMASVCGTSLALMDAGVPIKAPVAGVAMGLVKEGARFQVLTDILGDEDHLGDMDFKVAGTKDGITALQMDIKITSITREIMKVALEQARAGRLHILGEMNKVLAKPRENMSEWAPTIITLKIDPEKIRDVIGKGGAVIRQITEETGTSIDIENDGTVKIASVQGAAGREAQRRIELITADVEVGRIYEGRVARLMDFGAFVTILPGRDGLVHISQISEERVERVGDKLKEGDVVRVKVLEVDRQGRVRLSMRNVDAA